MSGLLRKWNQITTAMLAITGGGVILCRFFLSDSSAEDWLPLVNVGAVVLSLVWGACVPANYRREG